MQLMISKQEIERSIITKYRKTIWRPFTKAVRDYELISENDKIAVCISGGKDSMILAKCLEELQKHGKVKFSLEYIVMDPGYNKKNREKIIENAQKLGININICMLQTHHAIYVQECAEVFYMPEPKNWGVIKLHLATTLMM